MKSIHQFSNEIENVFLLSSPCELRIRNTSHLFLFKEKKKMCLGDFCFWDLFFLFLV